MKLFISLIVLVSLVIVWVVWGRMWLKNQPWAWSKRFFAWIESIEVMLWSKSETILWARFLMLIGALPLILEQLNVFNAPEIVGLVPEQYRSWLMLTFTVMGIVQEILRRYTTKPLAIVAVPDNPPIEVAVAIEQAASAKDNAVAVVKAVADEKAAPAAEKE